MTRLSLCALSVALAAGYCLAEPSTIEHAIHRFGDMEIHDSEMAHPEAFISTSTTTTSTSSTTTRTRPFPDTPESFWDAFSRAVQKQLMLQETLMRQIMKDIQDYLMELNKTFSWEEANSAAFAKINEMMEMITNRMMIARENVEELMATVDNVENETVRNATAKFMKEVRVQDVVVDALWASLRGMQTNAWVSGNVNTDDKDASMVANRAAEEFLTRMYNNLRAAGISEDDIVKFVPKHAVEFDGEQRNMGKRGSYSYGYGYPAYGYGYPAYSYGYGYPYYGYRYSYGYPAYGYSYGYPSYGFRYGYGYPAYGYPAYGYWRRLRPETPNMLNVPEMPNMLNLQNMLNFPNVPEQMMPTPTRTMYETTMGMTTTPIMTASNPIMNTTPVMTGLRYNTPMMTGQLYNTPMMMGQRYTNPAMATGMNTEYPTMFEQTVNPTFETMGPMNMEDNAYPMNTYNTERMPTTTAYTGLRNLAPEVPTPYGEMLF